MSVSVLVGRVSGVGCRLRREVVVMEEERVGMEGKEEVMAGRRLVRGDLVVDIKGHRVRRLLLGMGERAKHSGADGGIEEEG